jgi:peptidyl-prolyl cis-trans isomerase C
LLSTVALVPGCKPPFGFGEKSTSHAGCASCDNVPQAEAAQEEAVVIEGVEPGLLKETIVSFEGKPVITGRDYEKNFQMILEAQPALKDMLAYIPQEQQDQMYNQILEALILERVLLRHIKEEGIDRTPEYRKNAQRVHEAVDKDLALRAFESELLKEIVVSDDEARTFYDENKAKDPTLQRPPFLVTPGGIKAQAFEAANEKEAQELAEKARKGNFNQVAKDAKKSVTDYGLVNQQSFIDSEVKSKVLGTTKFPHIEVVKGSDGKYWVVREQSSQEPKYADFEKVKDAVKQIITGKKFNDLYTKKIEDLRSKYKVEVNKDYLKKRIKAPELPQPSGEQAESEAAQEATLKEPVPAKAPIAQQGGTTRPQGA